jgi:putative nucleotidyltransferase with HDIG domain
MSTVLEKSLLDIHPRELKGMVKDIPTLPAIYQKLFDKLQDPDVSVPEIAEIITQDQALSAKILHLVNSALYGSGTKTMTISRAVVILGFRAVRGAAMASGVFDYFKDETGSEGIDMIKFWEHSIAVACISKVIAEDRRMHHREEAFVAGLLHDVGKLIEKNYFSSDFDEICVTAEDEHLSWFEAEKKLFPIHHGTIGKTVFRSWKFSPNVVDAVQFHHRPSASSSAPELTALVHLADFMAYELGYGAPGAYGPRECDPEALRLLGITLEETLEYHERIREEMEHSLDILDLVE